jgi:very-short-patch-repair endonuclease
MSFGPINRVGGERRLNVAITRAREQVVIFAAVHSADIHAERTNSVGVKHLKALMEYAEKGYLEGTEQKCESREVTGVKKLVCDCLKANGYEFELDYGMSSYPVDIAVRDPKNPDRFILGIECDGSRYAAQATVRDRDVLRPSVLSNLGWKTFRAWSVDWALDRKRSEERFLENLKTKI